MGFCFDRQWMYKKLSYDQLLKLKSWFFESLSSILKKNKYHTLKDYLHITSKQGEVVYHIARQEYIWRTVFVHGSDQVIFYDEREKIELHADKAILAKIGALIRDTKKIAAQTDNKSTQSPKTGRPTTISPNWQRAITIDRLADGITLIPVT